MLKAAGLNKEDAMQMGILNEVGLSASAVLPAERLTEVQIPEGSNGFVAYLDTGRDVGHAVAVVGTDNKNNTVTIIDNASGKAVKETVSMDDFISRGFDGLVWVDVKTAENNAIIQDADSISVKPVIEAMLSDAKTKAALEEVKAKFEEYGAKEAGEKMFEKIAEGYTNADEIERMVIVAIAAFASTEKMEEYMGMKGTKYTKEEVAHAAMKNIGRVISFEQEGKIGKEQRDQEISLIRAVSDMLMAVSENEEVREMINTIRDEEGIRALSEIMPREVKVNRYVVANAMAGALSKDGEGDTRFGGFKIDLNAIKTELETREPKFNMFKKDREELMNLIEGGMRGNETALSPMLMNTRAIAAAA
jgi:hypothetical protein